METQYQSFVVFEQYFSHELLAKRNFMLRIFFLFYCRYFSSTGSVINIHAITQLLLHACVLHCGAVGLFLARQQLQNKCCRSKVTVWSGRTFSKACFFIPRRSVRQTWIKLVEQSSWCCLNFVALRLEMFLRSFFVLQMSKQHSQVKNRPSAVNLCSSHR